MAGILHPGALNIDLRMRHQIIYIEPRRFPGSVSSHEASHPPNAHGSECVCVKPNTLSVMSMVAYMLQVYILCVKSIVLSILMLNCAPSLVNHVPMYSSM